MMTLQLTSKLKKYEQYNNYTFKSKTVGSAKQHIAYKLGLCQYDKNRYFSTGKLRLTLLKYGGNNE